MLTFVIFCESVLEKNWAFKYPEFRQIFPRTDFKNDPIQSIFSVRAPVGFHSSRAFPKTRPAGRFSEFCGREATTRLPRSSSNSSPKFDKSRKKNKFTLESQRHKREAVLVENKLVVTIMLASLKMVQSSSAQIFIELQQNLDLHLKSSQHHHHV